MFFNLHLTFNNVVQHLSPIHCTTPRLGYTFIFYSKFVHILHHFFCIHRLLIMLFYVFFGFFHTLARCVLLFYSSKIPLSLIRVFVMNDDLVVVRKLLHELIGFPTQFLVHIRYAHHFFLILFSFP